ncbi:hypothetical protein OG413_45270 [Streptomyces sp. NBC_01433]|uniref:hypothetical protein n=1 Tax=Streptomyces sp. NBC_01433 TaxID=2903864 RepID=UPI0022519B99|nr:hypothetical protein [Streptomyces sp. NBC_01433]MCX4681321.1 hypothetical protein [Streptomyces sp. NBC_01433]MCX4681739.1 hypothetical protein [Streptomyces sp. NBC_01433]MCX4682398.1 hypothetical protein [Streptomyces sp. NBC_01433]
MDTARWMPWRRPLTTAARTIASWDPAVRLQSRAHLLWLAQQLTEARTTAHSARGRPHSLLAVLDLTLAPQLYADHMPAGAQQLTDALRAARRTAGHLAAATPRAARRTLTHLTDDLIQAEVLLEHACNDVRGADLRTADLTYLYLGGLRWNSATQWPAPWRDQIRADSDPVDGGHQVRDG